MYDFNLLQNVRVHLVLVPELSTCEALFWDLITHNGTVHVMFIVGTQIDIAGAANFRWTAVTGALAGYIIDLRCKTFWLSLIEHGTYL